MVSLSNSSNTVAESTVDSEDKAMKGRSAASAPLCAANKLAVLVISVHKHVNLQPPPREPSVTRTFLQPEGWRLTAENQGRNTQASSAAGSTNTRNKE